MLKRLRLLVFIVALILAVGVGIGVARYLSEHTSHTPRLTKEEACKLAKTERHLPNQGISLNEAICNGTVAP